ncbi:hypothetical protein ISF_06564 [Cordyceps fumosorosea ARSEF 2679]|uniref:C6 zinc finger domain protein n=1 Tax=Cordyceps fumosorosea (strain ARSEF 2679) TaxID=1081104 RepID=A0A167RNX8_CORFA|nr:hypothetical protein ISF_06564 [Cordyceps fumosorosea ARSEF 2679]OAA58781.1 hypothetical protein ISF_06564 [Cordyceps fumosorosea ARSEF 2679]
MPYVDAFRHRLVDDLDGGGPFATTVRKASMLRALHREPAFRHAAVAFGAACGLVDGEEWPLERTVRWPVPAPNKTLALRHYGRCLQGIRGLIANGGGGEGGNLDDALFCALLCICFELRIGTPHLALHHLEHSLSIIQANWTNVSDDLVLAFAKMDVQASMFLRHRVPRTDMASLAAVADGAAEKDDAALACLLGRTFQLIRAYPGMFRRLSSAIQIPRCAAEDLATLTGDLQRFRARHAILDVPGPGTTKSLPLSQQTLWITCLTLHVILSSCLRGDDEMLYDGFLAHFEAITTMSENILRTDDSRRASTRTGYKTFRLDTGLLHPLFMTGQLCRHTGVRRRVLRLLGGVSFDEGVWDASSGEKYVRILMRLEEQGLVLAPEEEEEETDDLVGRPPSVIAECNRTRTLDVQPTAAERYSTMFFRFDRQTGQWDDLVESIEW